MAEFNPYAILAAGMPAALQGLQTLAGGAMDVARYNRAQADNERVRKDMQAERMAEIDRMDQRQTRREDAIHQRNRAEGRQDMLDSAKKDYAAEGGDLSKAGQMSIEQLAAETAKLKKANFLTQIHSLSDAQIRAKAEAAGIQGSKTRGLGELSEALAIHSVEQETKAELAKRKMIDDHAANDPGVQEAIRVAKNTISIAEAARAKALSPKGLDMLREDQRRRIQDAIAKSPEVIAALRKFFPKDTDFTPRMHAVAVGNYNAAVNDLGPESLGVINGAMSAASQNAMAMFEKSNLAAEANWMRQYNTGIRSADANLAKTIDAVTKIYGRDPVFGPIIMRKALGDVPLLQVQDAESETDAAQAPASMFPVPPQPPANSTPIPLSSGAVFNPGGLAPIQAAPAVPAGVGGLNLLNAPGGWNPAGDPNVPPPNPLPGAGYYDGYPARQERGVSFE